MKERAWKEAFAKTETPLGWYIAGKFSAWLSRERFDLLKKSAEAGCSWAQIDFGEYFQFSSSEFTEKDENAHGEWLKKAAAQDNRWAVFQLGVWFDHQSEPKEAYSYFLRASELGHRFSNFCLGEKCILGDGCDQDLRQGLIWSAQSDDDSHVWMELKSVALAYLADEMENNFNEVCHALGWGLYWYLYGISNCKDGDEYVQAFGGRCLEYYCSCVELQQKSIFTFLWFWNRTTGIKDPGQMIGKMVWEGRADNVVKLLSEKEGEAKEPETKRIKK
jgi:hypothetical protein